MRCFLGMIAVSLLTTSTFAQSPLAPDKNPPQQQFATPQAQTFATPQQQVVSIPQVQYVPRAVVVRQFVPQVQYQVVQQVVQADPVYQVQHCAVQQVQRVQNVQNVQNVQRFQNVRQRNSKTVTKTVTKTRNGLLSLLPF